KTRSRRTPEFGQGPGPADVAFSLVQADLLRGKSIGFLPTKVHAPKDRERELNGWSDVDLVIDEWILLEYACTFLPAQQNAVVEQVAKGFAIPHDFLKAMGIDVAVTEPDALAKRSPQQRKRGDLFANASCSASESVVISGFTPLEEIEKAFERHLSGINLQQLADETAISVLDRLRGRV